MLISLSLRPLDFYKYSKELDKSLTWTPEHLVDYQAKRVVETVNFCYQHVPFYRDLWNKHGVDIKKIQSHEDLYILPYTYKKDLQQFANKFIPEGIPKRKIYPTRSGGSTGLPVHYHMTLESRMMEWAFYLRYWYWHGMNWWHSPKVIMRGSHHITKKLIKRNFFNNSFSLSPFSLTEDKLRYYAHFIAQKKIPYLITYPSIAELLARVIDGDNKLAGKMPVKKVFCASEQLYESQKEIIEKIFSCPLNINYGHREMAALFQDCPEGDGYHVITDYSYVEFDPLPGNTNMNEIIGTSFINIATPLIRYRTQDYAVLRDSVFCSCGLPFPKVVKNVEGRSGDIIVTPKGRFISPTYLEFVCHYFRNFDDIQIRQDALDHISILIKPGASFVETDTKGFIKALLTRIGEPINVDISLVENIDKPINQKKRLFVSEISQKLLSEKGFLSS